jgi:O-antigen ligase
MISLNERGAPPEDPSNQRYFWSELGQFAALGMMASMPISRAAFNIFSLTMILSWIFSGDYRSFPLQISRHPALLLCVSFFVMVLVSTSYSPAPNLEKWSQVATYSKLLYIPIMVSVLKDRRWIDRAWIALICGLCLLLLLFIADFWVQIPGSHSAKTGSAGVFNNTIVQGLDFATLTILSLYFWSKGSNRRSMRSWLLIALATASATATVYFNPGRGAQLALMASLIVFTIVLAPSGMKLISVSAMALILAATALLSQNFTSRFVTAINEIDYTPATKNTSVGLRLAAWRTGISIWADSPWLGNGAGAYRYLIGKEHAEEIGGCPNPTCEQPHNQFILTAVEQGTIGLALLIAMLSACALSASKSPSQLRGFSIAFVVLFFIHSMFDSGLQMNTQVFVFIAVMGLIISTTNEKLRNPATV